MLFVHIYGRIKGWGKNDGVGRGCGVGGVCGAPAQNALGTRQVFAGIKSAYDPETLKGRLTVVVALASLQWIMRRRSTPAS